MYHHKSGAQKRKQRVERDQKRINSQKGQGKLSNFNFVPKIISVPNNKTDPEQPSTSYASPTNTPLCKQSEEPPESAEKTEELFNDSVNALLTPPKPVLNEQSKSQNNKKLNNYDIGTATTEFISSQLVEEIIHRGHEELPEVFPRDKLNEPFPNSLLHKILPNGEKVKRDWLVWSRSMCSFHCLPCRLFSTTSLNRSHLCEPGGYSKNQAWKKLYEKLKLHENSKDHMQCYVKWREVQMRSHSESTINHLLCEQISAESSKWREILTRILDTILFLGERGLALRGESHLIGDRNNGNFLGILELISHYDPLLRGHLERVKLSQNQHKRLQVHYLSPDIQNEFIQLCADHVRLVILKEREKAKYYTIIVDATPDSSHVEQTTFILRYLDFDIEKKAFKIQERFLNFVDCNQKTGEAIAKLICETLRKYEIPLSECRGQGYDNGKNMSGEYKGAQSHILRENPQAAYSPCGAHSLNLCGVDSAECCPKAITFFGVIQKCFNIFSSSPQRWEILKSKIPCSLHRLSETRWSARIEAVKPFAHHISGITEALQNLKTLNLTAETRRDVDGILKYISGFECVLMSSIWSKILSSINEVNLVLQYRDATIDVEVDNLSSLLTDLQFLRDRWSIILEECKLVAGGLENTSSTLPLGRHKKRLRRLTDDETQGIFQTDEETEFKINTFYVILDSVIAGINNRFIAVKKLNETFSFLWKFPLLDEDHIRKSAKNFLQQYPTDVADELSNELIHLSHIHGANFKGHTMPFVLLNEIYVKNLDVLFPNICVALRIFCTLPVSVASAERSFSVLSRVKHFHRSCSSQMRVAGLAMLCLESELARKVNFSEIINSFALVKARRALLE